jgi:hypothetical protein
MNNFDTDLLYSLESNFDKTINEAYFCAFPHLIKINEIEDKERQMLGIDKKLVFESGNTINSERLPVFWYRKAAKKFNEDKNFWGNIIKVKISYVPRVKNLNNKYGK